METAMEDRVIKARFWDGNDVLQKIVMEFTYRFDDVLDAGKLKSSLERLLEIGEWKSLGARLKKNVRLVTPVNIVRIDIDCYDRRQRGAWNSTSRLDMIRRGRVLSGHTRC